MVTGIYDFAKIVTLLNKRAEYVVSDTRGGTKLIHLCYLIDCNDLFFLGEDNKVRSLFLNAIVVASISR